MKLTDEERASLVELYLEKAEETFSDLQLAIDNGKWSMAANRMYYTLFHAVTALLVRDGYPAGSHLGTKIKFGKYYVLEGKFTADQGRLYSQLETLREKADYDCFFKATKEDVSEYYPNAIELYKRIKDLINILPDGNLAEQK